MVRKFRDDLLRICREPMVRKFRGKNFHGMGPYI